MYNHVIWPEQHDPRHSAIYALNDIDVKLRQKWVGSCSSMPRIGRVIFAPKIRSRS